MLLVSARLQYSTRRQANWRGKISAQPKMRTTLEEYLELDRNSQERLEYWEGDGFWLQREYNPLEEVVRIESLGCEIRMRDLYRRIEFTESGDDQSE